MREERFTSHPSAFNPSHTSPLKLPKPAQAMATVLGGHHHPSLPFVGTWHSLSCVRIPLV